MSSERTLAIGKSVDLDMHAENPLSQLENRLFLVGYLEAVVEAYGVHSVHVNSEQVNLFRNTLRRFAEHPQDFKIAEVEGKHGGGIAVSPHDDSSTIVITHEQYTSSDARNKKDKPFEKLRVEFRRPIERRSSILRRTLPAVTSRLNSPGSQKEVTSRFVFFDRKTDEVPNGPRLTKFTSHEFRTITAILQRTRLSLPQAA